MPTQESAAQAARATQRAASKRATVDLLRSKRRAEREIKFALTTETGKTQEVTLLFRSIGSVQYDELLTKNPPKTDQKAEGASYNIHSFAPALLSKVCVDPEMTPEEWTEIWNSEAWNRGEVMQLFFAAVELCNQGMEIHPTVGV